MNEANEKLKPLTVWAVNLLTGLDKEHLKELLRVAELIYDPLGQELIKRAAEPEEKRGFFFDGKRIWLTLTDLQQVMSGIPTKIVLAAWDTAWREGMEE